MKRVATRIDPPPIPEPDTNFLSEQALQVRQHSIKEWGPNRAVNMVGRSPCFVELLAKIEKIAKFGEPVLITGESGVGKESIAQAIYLLSDLRGGPFAPVNCPQYCDGNLTVSELFGHRRGSFTGAVTDRKGVFELAEGGVIFLDEIGDLHLEAQAMLLRALATGEFKPIGADRSRVSEARLVAATNRPLNQLVGARQFRNDLYFRLRYFQVPVPPLRARGDDWRLLLDYSMALLRAKYGVVKRFSPSSLKLLEGYDWPGNVRQLISVATAGYAMADGDAIEPEEFQGLLEEGEGSGDSVDETYRRVVEGGESFWNEVYRPFLDRDLNRREVRAIVKRGYLAASGNYQNLVELFHMSRSNYQRFMDFLRHHRLKP